MTPLEWVNVGLKEFNKQHSLYTSVLTYTYHNVSKVSDRNVWANSVDPDQTAPDERAV